ncbi:hypothetical protein COP1_006638 [Malus domestica]
MLDLEFSTPKSSQGSGVSQGTIRSEPVIPLFPLLEEETDRGKRKAVPEGSQPVIEPVLEKEFPSFPLLTFNNRKQSEQERTKYRMPIITGKSSQKESSAAPDKPLPYRPPPLAHKGGGTNWRKPESKKEAFIGNDRSPNDESALFFQNNIATQQLRDELAELRRAVVQNEQPRARPAFRITYQKLILNTSMNKIHFLPTSRCPHSQHSRVRTEITFSSSLITGWRMRTT